MSSWPLTLAASHQVFDLRQIMPPHAQRLLQDVITKRVAEIKKSAGSSS